MKESWELLLQALPNAIGGLIAAATIAVISAIYTEAGLRWAALSAVVVAFIVTGLLYAGVDLWIAILIAGGILGTVGCAYFAFARTPPLLEGGRGVLKHSRGSSWAKVGLIIFPLLSLGGAGYHLYEQIQTPAEVIILVADFEGLEPQKYRVTETILARLSLAFEVYDDVQIKALGKPITEGEGSDVARSEGEKNNASIVIWGWYGATTEFVSLSVHFEVLRPPQFLPELGPEAKGQTQTIAIEELESFTLQTKLSSEMAYLTLFTVGMTRFTAGDLNGAISRFSDALNQAANRSSALDQGIVYIMRGNAYFLKHDYDQAVDDFDRAIQLQPGSALAYMSRGTAYGRKNNLKQALSDLTVSIELSPDFALAYQNRGLARHKSGNFDDAIDDFNEAIQLQPDEIWNYVNRGLSYSSKGDHDQAIADFTKAVQLNPDFAVAYYNRGNVFANKGDHEQAIDDFGQAIQLQPDDAEAHYNRGTAYLYEGAHDLAIADYNRAIELKFYDAGVYSNRGLAYTEKGDYEQAIADYDRSIQLQPNNAVVYTNRGLAYVREGDLKRAITDLNQAIRLQPDYSLAYYSRGIVYAAKGEFGQAVTDFNMVLELDNDPHTQQMAESKLEALGIR